MARGNNAPQKLSREQIIALYKAGPDAVFSLIEYLQDNLEQLSNRIRTLELQVSKNSRNSNKPPSSDGLNKPPPKKKRKRSGKKPGGQKGHEGTTLQMSATPDTITIHKVECCENCGCTLKDKPVKEYNRRQKIDYTNRHSPCNGYTSLVENEELEDVLKKASLFRVSPCEGVTKVNTEKNTKYIGSRNFWTRYPAIGIINQYFPIISDWEGLYVSSQVLLSPFNV